MQAAGVAFGFAIGFSLGFFGGGGSILAVQIFVYVLGFDPKSAIAMSLAVVGATSLAGALSPWREGHVKFRVAMIFGPVAMAGTYVGTRLAHRLTGDEQLAIFAVIMLAAAAVMIRGRRPDDPPAARAGHAGGSAASMAFTAAEGLIVGGFTGMVGVGGGFLIVPAFVWSGLAMRDAVGTSLLVIAMNCAVGIAGYLGHVPIAWAAVAMVTAGTVPGVVAGTYAMRSVPQQALRRGFAVFLACLAAFMLYERFPR